MFHLELSATNKLYLILFFQVIQINSHRTRSFLNGEYFDIPERAVINPGAYLCRNTGENMECCDCRASCLKIKSCCIDKLWSKGLDLRNNYFDFLRNESKSFKELYCENLVPLSNLSGHTSERVWMVVTCPESADKNDARQCQANQFHVPVFGSDYYVYRNPFCAKCNGINILNPLNISILCKRKLKGNVLKEHLLERYEECDISIKENDTQKHIMRCDQSVFANSCHVKSKNNNLCRPYSGRFDKLYNFYCYKSEMSNNILKKVSKSCELKLVTPHITRGFFPWSITIQFDLKSFLTIRHNDVLEDNSLQLCYEDEIYNILTGKCIKFSDSNGYNNEMKCLKDSEAQRPNLTNCLLVIKLQFVIHLKTITNLSEIMLSLKHLPDLKNYLYGYQSYNEPNKWTTSLATFGKDNQQMKHSTIWILEVYNSYGLKSRYVANDNSFRQIYDNVSCSINVSCGENVTENSKENKLCSEYEIYESSDLMLTSCCNQTQNKHFEIAVWYKTNEFGKNQMSIDNRRVSFCKRFYSSLAVCSKTVIEKFKIDENMSVTYYKNNSNKEQKLHFFQYQITSNGFRECNQLKTTVENKWIHNIRNIEWYIYLIGTPTSIVCYMSVIGTYFLFDELKTIAGLNICTMCFFLWLSDSIYCVTALFNFHRSLCKFLGIFLHWTLLISYFWIVLIAIDLMLRVSKTNYIPKKNVFLRSCVISILLPSILVGTASALNEFNLAFYIGYGDHGVCWIVGNHARVIFYVIPVGVSFGVAVLLLIYIIFVVKRSQKMMHGCVSKNMSLSKIAVKLVLILGLPEAIGFFQHTNDNDLSDVMNQTVLFIYTFLRSFRGVVLFAVHALNTKTINVFKRALKKKFSSFKLRNIFYRLRYTKKSFFTTVQNTNGEFVIDQVQI